MVLVPEFIFYVFVTVTVTFVSHKMIQMYKMRRGLPPGPFPLPLIGNALPFLLRKELFHQMVHQISLQYGPVFTLFFGSMPVVIVTDPAIGLQALKNHQFAGRAEVPIIEWLFGSDSIDIVFGDYSKEWEALKRVAHSAVRKYSISPALPVVAVATVDRLIAKVSEDPFNNRQEFGNLFMAILAEATFGKTYEFHDPEFVKLRDFVGIIDSVMILFALPILRHVFYKKWELFVKVNEFHKHYIPKMYNTALQDYTNSSKDKSFCDTIITAQREAEVDETWMKPYLKPEKMHNVITDLLIAGTDALIDSLGWIFIMMSKYPEMQQRMRHEVESVVGDEEPNNGHRTECHFISAFISETMRFRPSGISDPPHKTTVDTELNGYKIFKDTIVILPLNNMFHDEKQWLDGQSFKPERFLMDDGSYNPKPNPYFVPFGEGKRSCPGAKFAINTLFLIVARFLQQTTDIQVIGGVNEDHMKGDVRNPLSLRCIDYQIKLSLKSR